MKRPIQIHELGELFEKVQLQSVFQDGKTFPDCVPKRNPEAILTDYHREKTKPGFNLKDFVQANFDLPASVELNYSTDSSKSIQQHIINLWDFLTRQSGTEQSSVIPLPKSYVVPGGRFREIYYWDSYFTMLGLLKSNRADLALNMVDNFSFLIDTIGYIPNGNRTYFIGRSQPPFYSLMVKLLADELGNEILLQRLPQLEREYQFWMRGAEAASMGSAIHRVVKLKDGTILNRYWDENDTPRPESFKEDVELSHQSSQKPNDLYRNLRAAAESGWDFSSRWFKEGGDFSTIHTTEIIPVDLNCLLVHLEQTLSVAYRLSGNESNAQQFDKLAQSRTTAIQKYCWNDQLNFYFDYDFRLGQLKTSWTLAGFFPMFFTIATQEQAVQLENHLRLKFLKPGGLTTTLVHSGQQWDAPNGWAPLQWICYKGFLNYKLTATAQAIQEHWLTSNEAVFKKSGKMTEKYDVWNDNADASGGEYPNQDGFGWTNGVYMAMVSHR